MADTYSCPSRGAPRCWWSTWPPWCWHPTVHCLSLWRHCRSPALVCCFDTRICSPGPGRSAGSRTSGSPSCPPLHGYQTRPWFRSLALWTRDNWYQLPWPWIVICIFSDRVGTKLSRLLQKILPNIRESSILSFYIYIFFLCRREHRDDKF